MGKITEALSKIEKERQTPPASPEVPGRFYAERPILRWGFLLALGSIVLVFVFGFSVGRKQIEASFAKVRKTSPPPTDWVEPVGGRFTVQVYSFLSVGPTERAIEELKEKGYEVGNAHDGEAGLKMAQDIKPDLILLDLILPKIDGFTVLKELKKSPETKDIPVIVLTNLESAEDVEKVIEFGATTYLVKAHYELEDIVAKIKEVLEK